MIAGAGPHGRVISTRNIARTYGACQAETASSTTNSVAIDSPSGHDVRALGIDIEERKERRGRPSAGACIHCNVGVRRDRSARRCDWIMSRVKVHAWRRRVHVLISSSGSVMDDAIKNRIKAFRSSITPYLISHEDFLDWREINAALSSWASTASAIDKRLEGRQLGIGLLTEILGSIPRSYKAILTLIAFNTSDAQVDKWGVPPTIPTNASRRRELAALLMNIGIGNVLSKGSRTIDLLRVAEINRDSLRRRFRSTDRLSARVSGLVREQVAAFNEHSQFKLTIDGATIADSQLKRSTSHFLLLDGKPVAGVAAVFQNQSGGRQQRDLTNTYPLLQERLATYSMALILVTDGQGLREASDNSLQQLFERVRYPMNLQEAESGRFQEALIDLVQRPVESEIDEAAILTLIEEGLSSGESVPADDLPISSDYAKLSFARYVSSKPALALRISLDQSELAWRRRTLVADARAIRNLFSRDMAMRIFEDLVGSIGERATYGENIEFSSFQIEENEFLPERFFLTSYRAEDHIEAIRPIVDALMPHSDDARFVFDLVPTSVPTFELRRLRSRQAVSPINVIFISPPVLERMAQAIEPRRVLVGEILKQSDLAKASPFILSNATPSRMFFGRDAEAATAVTTLASNSVALLGSRRIGKTSLLRRVAAMLSEGDGAPYFVDCQTVRTWADFGGALQRSTGVRFEGDFRPPMLHSAVEQLAKERGQVPVLLMDEVDQLIQWDMEQKDFGSVPEAFFRTCRAISQEGTAQFVFSGERTIANKIWDPESPHWNFCRSIELHQIRREPTEELFFGPLRAMNVNFEGQGDIADALWLRTSGHPQIAQQIGDEIVKVLDGREDREKLLISLPDVDSVTEHYDFAEHYLTTYWGQASRNEKILSLVIAEGDYDASQIGDRLLEIGAKSVDVGAALRILKLYGVVEGVGDTFSLRAEWFPNALEHFGGAEAVLRRLLED